MSNLIRYKPSQVLFARVRVRGKLIRRSLKTKAMTVAKLRLTDLEKDERQAAERAQAFDGGKMVFTDALAIFRQRVQSDASLKPRTKAHREERFRALMKTWPDPERTDVGKITKQDCLAWAVGYATSPINFNKTV